MKSRLTLSLSIIGIVCSQGMAGQGFVRTNSLDGEKHQFMLGNIPAGIYLVRIMDGEKAETVKLIKQ